MIVSRKLLNNARICCVMCFVVLSSTHTMATRGDAPNDAVASKRLKAEHAPTNDSKQSAVDVAAARAAERVAVQVRVSAERAANIRRADLVRGMVRKILSNDMHRERHFEVFGWPSYQRYQGECVHRMATGAEWVEAIDKAELVVIEEIVMVDFGVGFARQSGLLGSVLLTDAQVVAALVQPARLASVQTVAEAARIFFWTRAEYDARKVSRVALANLITDTVVAHLATPAPAPAPAT